MIEARGDMKKIVCRRKEFFLVGIIVFLMLMMSSCSSNESNHSETGDDTHRSEQTGISTALTGIIDALAGSVYSVKYDANTGTGEVPVDGNDYEEGDQVIVLGSGTLTKDGYTFSGWNTQADGNGTTYQEGDEFLMGSEDITLYAIWNEKGVLVVRADATAGDAMINALAANNYKYVATDRVTFEAMSIDDLFDYDAVFYAGNSSGDSWAKAMAYLDAGGRFFIADNDVGWSYGGINILSNIPSGDLSY